VIWKVEDARARWSNRPTGRDHWRRMTEVASLARRKSRDWGVTTCCVDWVRVGMTRMNSKESRTGFADPGVAVERMEY
jgi:hypothetical protein